MENLSLGSADAQLLKTVPNGATQEDFHDHVIYYDEDNQKFYCLSDDKGRSHAINVVPAELEPNPEAVMPQEDGTLLDQSTGKMYRQGEEGFLIFDEALQDFRPLNPEQIYLEPDATDGHTHEGFIEYQRDLSKPKVAEHEVIREVWDLYKYACDNDSESLEKARESYDFYKGKQWSENLKAILNGLDRACVTINKVQKGIDTFSGIERENRQDMVYSPIEEGDALAAEIYSKTAKIVYSTCKYPMVASDVFLETIITGRGWFDVYVDMQSSLEGDIKIRKRKFDRVKTLEHEERDLSDCEAVFKEDMYSFHKLKSLYPKRADEIQRDFSNYETGVYEEIQRKGHITRLDKSDGDQYALSDNKSKTFMMPKSYQDTMMVDVARKEYKVITRWMRVYEKGMVLVIPDLDVVYNLKGWKAKDVKKLKEIPGAQIVKRDVARIRITKIAGNVVLSDENVADLPEDDFFLVPSYAYLADGEWWGKVEGLKDPQRELNQRRSQIIDIGNKCANYGYYYDDDTFETPQDETAFVNNATKPGAVHKVTDTGRPPLEMQGAKFPSELVNFSQMAEETIESLLNVIPEPGGANESGEHLLQRQRQKLTGNEIIFESFKMAREKVAWLVLKLIHRYYSPERIYSMLASEGADLMGEPLSEYDPDMILQALERSRPEHYNLQVTETEFSPTSRMALQMILQRLAEAGQPIPPEAILQVVDIPQSKKQELLGYIQGQQEMDSQAAMDTSNTELEKTILAQGIVPPAVAERLQLNQAQPIESYAGGAAGIAPGQEDQFAPQVAGDVPQPIAPPGQEQPMEEEVLG